MADPIVVSQFIAKRSELAGLIDAKRSELNTLLKDLDHIDGSIKIFAPERAPELLPVKRRTSDRTFARHELTRRIFGILREAEGPMSAGQIARLIAEDKGEGVDLRMLTGRVLRALKRQEKVLKSRIEGQARLWDVRP